DGDKPYMVATVPILHGHEMSRVQANKVLGYKATVGHFHRGTIDNLGVIIPTLEDQEHVDYFTFHRQPWTPGWATITEYKGHAEKPELVLLYNEKFYNFEKIVKAKSMGTFTKPKEITVTYKLED